MEQKLADRELTADLQAMGLTELNRRLLNRTEQIEQTMGKRVAALVERNSKLVCILPK